MSKQDLSPHKKLVYNSVWNNEVIQRSEKGCSRSEKKEQLQASLLGEVKKTFYLVFQDELYMLKTMFGQSVQSYANSASAVYKVCVRPLQHKCCLEYLRTTCRNVSFATLRFSYGLISVQTKPSRLGFVISETQLKVYFWSQTLNSGLQANSHWDVWTERYKGDALRSQNLQKLQLVVLWKRANNFIIFWNNHVVLFVKKTSHNMV